MPTVDISSFNGLVFSAIDGAEKGSMEIKFTTVDNQVFTMYHDQDCCESVELEDVCGDITDIIGHSILDAYESKNEGSEENDGTYTWTFYTISTIKGSVVLRWYGSSNGYYSESVTIKQEA